MKIISLLYKNQIVLPLELPVIEIVIFVDSVLILIIHIYIFIYLVNLHKLLHVLVCVLFSACIYKNWFIIIIIIDIPSKHINLCFSVFFLWLFILNWHSRTSFYRARIKTHLCTTCIKNKCIKAGCT